MPGQKKLQYLSFGVFDDDLAPLLQHLDRIGVARTAPHPLSDGAGVWVRDPDGNAVQLVAAGKVSPDEPALQAPPAHASRRSRRRAGALAGGAGCIRGGCRTCCCSAPTCCAR